jgi:hypothetical protein
MTNDNDSDLPPDEVPMEIMKCAMDAVKVIKDFIDGKDDFNDSEKMTSLQLALAILTHSFYLSASDARKNLQQLLDRSMAKDFGKIT